MKETSYSPTGMLLAASALPAAAQRAAVGNPAHSAAVASAPVPGFDPTAFAGIYNTKLDAKLAANMVARAPNADCLDHVLALGERRQSAIEAVFHYWALGPRARAHLATGKLPAQTADMILDRSEFSNTEKLHAARHASPNNAIDWIASGAELDDDTIIDLLVTSRKATTTERERVWSSLARIAYLHPGIRSWLAADADYGPAASVVALSDTDGLALCDNARGPLGDEKRQILWAYALSNLIDHPSTSEKVRERALGVIDAAGLTSTRRRHGVGTTAFIDAESLAEMNEATIERILTVAIPDSGYMPASRLFVLADVATTAALSADQAIRLMYRMSHYECGPVIGREFMRTCHARLAVIASEVADAKEVKDMIRGYGEDHLDYDVDRKADPAKGTVRIRRMPGTKCSTFTSNEGPVEELMVLPAEVDRRGLGFPLGGRPVEAAQLLTAIIGDNEQAWRVLLGIADTFTGTISELGEAAMLL